MLWLDVIEDENEEIIVQGAGCRCKGIKEMKKQTSRKTDWAEMINFLVNFLWVI